jgi:hypothetical protein
MPSKTTCFLITSADWGKIKVNENEFADLRCYPGSAEFWDWAKTGTDHVPGVQIQDVGPLITAYCTDIVIGTGFNQQLFVMRQTKEFLARKRVNLHILETSKAVQLYNEIARHKRAGCLIHGGC